MRPAGWGRLITAMLTPMDERLDVNYQAARELAAHLVNTGTDTILVGGTTGESPTITRSERLRILETVLDAVGGRAKVIAGTGTNSTAASIELTREAEVTGAHGIMLVTPYYNKPPQAGLVDHFRQIAAATRLPVMMYNVPGRTSVNMLPATVAKLAEVDNIVAVKEASGNLDQITEILRRVPRDFLVYSGDDSLTLPVMSAGGQGIVSVAAHVAGRQIKEMLESYVTGNVGRAAELHRWLLPVVRALFMTASPIPVKAAVGLVGINVGRCRPPLCELTPEEMGVLRATMSDAGLLAGA